MSTVLKGRGCGGATVGGTLRMITVPEQLKEVGEFDIIATEMTDPNMIDALRRCQGWVTRFGGITCHAAIIAREMKKPAVVGMMENFNQLQDGSNIVINGQTGEVTIL